MGLRQMVSQDFCFSSLFGLVSFPAPAHAIPRLPVSVIHIPLAESAGFTSEITLDLFCPRRGKQPTAVGGAGLLPVKMRWAKV